MLDCPGWAGNFEGMNRKLTESAGFRSRERQIPETADTRDGAKAIKCGGGDEGGNVG